MFRPTASDVSALSGIVAKGHQTVHSVSSAPSKIPYGGFSPVRLQTGCQPRPSWLAPFIRGHSRGLPGERCFRSRVSPAALTVSDTTHPSSGPWLRQRLFCPPASSLTMATSELLRTPSGLCAYPRRSQPAEGPHFYLPELADVPPSLLRWLQGSPKTPGLAFAHLEEARQPYDPPTGLRVADLTKLQRSLNAAARQLACPAPDGTFTTELACVESLRRKSVMTTGTFISSLTGLAPAALAALWAALQVNPTNPPGRKAKAGTACGG
jgi:hypothetical protein